MQSKMSQPNHEKEKKNKVEQTIHKSFSILPNKGGQQTNGQRLSCSCSKAKIAFVCVCWGGGSSLIYERVKRQKMLLN